MKCLLRVFLLTFIFIFAAVFGVSSFSTYNETLHETTLQNLKPSTNYLNVSKSLDPSKVIDIQSGVSFSIALDNEGKLHYWGTNPGRYVVSNIIELTKDENLIRFFEILQSFVALPHLR